MGYCHVYVMGKYQYFVEICTQLFDLTWNSCEKCNYRSLAGIEPAALRFRCRSLTSRATQASCRALTTSSCMGTAMYGKQDPSSAKALRRPTFAMPYPWFWDKNTTARNQRKKIIFKALWQEPNLRPCDSGAALWSIKWATEDSCGIA